MLCPQSATRQSAGRNDSRELRDIIQFVDKSPAPSLLPIFRSHQQAELLALLLSDADREWGLTELSERTSVPYSSVHREVARAERTGLVASRSVGRTRLVRADPSSPYFEGLADVLVRAFGPPWVLREVLDPIEGIEATYLFGSWAARFSGNDGPHPVGDLDVLILGDPDRELAYAAAAVAEQRLGRPVEITIRPADWLQQGTGAFHDTVTSRPLVPVVIATKDVAEPAASTPPLRQAPLRQPKAPRPRHRQ